MKALTDMRARWRKRHVAISAAIRGSRRNERGDLARLLMNTA